MVKNPLNTPEDIIQRNFSQDAFVRVFLENVLKGRFGPDARGAADTLAQLLYEKFGVTL